MEHFQNLADVSTDKLFTQIPSTDQGKIHKLHIAEGEACQVGGLLLELDVADEEAVHEVKKGHTDKDKTTTKPFPDNAMVKADKPKQDGDQIKAQSTPAVREYARQKQVDIHRVVVEWKLEGNRT